MASDGNRNEYGSLVRSKKKKRAVRQVNFQVAQENWQLRSLCEVKTQFKMKVKYTAFEIKKKPSGGLSFKETGTKSW